MAAPGPAAPGRPGRWRSPSRVCGSRPAAQSWGAIGDLNVRVDAMALDRPAGPSGEPEGVARLGHPPAVDEVVAAVDADHAAPGAGADEGPETPLAEAQRSRCPRRCPRPDRSRPPSGRAGASRGYRAGSKPRGWSQAVTAELSRSRTSSEVWPPPLWRRSTIRPSRPLSRRRSRCSSRPAQAHHVGNVHVAEPAPAALPDEAPVRGDPCVVAQLLLVGEGLHGHACGRAPSRAPSPTSTIRLAAPTRSGPGPVAGSTGRPSTLSTASPTPAPA